METVSEVRLIIMIMFSFVVCLLFTCIIFSWVGKTLEAKQNQCRHFFFLLIFEVDFFFLCSRRAQKEVEALSGLEHCNIVRYYTCWLEDNRYEVESGARSSSGS